MTCDIKNRRYAFGPYVRAGAMTLCRLWWWDYIRVGSRWKIVRHEVAAAFEAGVRDV